MKKLRTAPLLFLTLLAALAAAGETFAQNKETILRLHGSNTIGAQLAPDLAKNFLKKLGATSVLQTDIAVGTETDVEGYFPDSKQTKVIEIRAHGSSTAFKGLKNNQCDIGMASRKIKDSEVNELSFLGDMTGSACEHVLAMDGVAVIVNPSNAAVSKLNVSNLASILSGKINNWSELSWGSAPISIQARDENSGTHDTVKSIVLGEKKFTGAAKRWDSNEMLSDAVAADVNAIGYCGMPYVKSNKAVEIADGGSFVQPTVFTVGTEDYPLSRRLYFYTPAAPENRHVQDFIAFALSDEGQELVRKHHFVDLTVSAKEHQIKLTPGTNENHQVLQQYMIAVRGAKRLSANFRFKGETLELDNRAVRDLERLTAFLSENNLQQIILAGFSDRHEDSDRLIEGSFDSNYDQNLELSCKRAEVVKEELRSRGITVADVLCVGSEMPMASNATETGREKNRRVEIWVK